MKMSPKIPASKPVSEYTEEDWATLDQYIEVPFFWETRQRLRAWRARRALGRREADGGAVPAGEVDAGDGSV